MGTLLLYLTLKLPLTKLDPPFFKSFFLLNPLSHFDSTWYGLIAFLEQCSSESFQLNTSLFSFCDSVTWLYCHIRIKICKKNFAHESSVDILCSTNMAQAKKWCKWMGFLCSNSLLDYESCSWFVYIERSLIC